VSIPEDEVEKLVEELTKSFDLSDRKVEKGSSPESRVERFKLNSLHEGFERLHKGL